MAAENCQGISLNCLGLIGSRRIPCPPCMAWLQLNDEGSVGCCECDWNAAISLRLCRLLTGRPGFMQDPCPNTVNGTLMGAHCSSPTQAPRLRPAGRAADPPQPQRVGHRRLAAGALAGRRSRHGDEVRRTGADHPRHRQGGGEHRHAARPAAAAPRSSWRWTTSPTPATARASTNCSSSATSPTR